MQCGEGLFPHTLRERLANLEVCVAGFGRDRKAWRHRHADTGHLREVRSFSPEQSPDTVPGTRVCFRVSDLVEGVDPFRHCDLLESSVEELPRETVTSVAPALTVMLPKPGSQPLFAHTALALPPGLGEVLVVLRRDPCTAPRPADRLESTHHDIVRMDHPRHLKAPVCVGSTLDRRYGRSSHPWVEEWIDVDRASVGVFGPANAPFDLSLIHI